MKKISVLICIILSVVTLVSCQNETGEKKEENTNTATNTPDTDDPRYRAKEFMEPWQIDKVVAEFGEIKDELLPLSKEQAESYINQEKLNDDKLYAEQWGIELNEDTKEDSLLLDAVHEYMDEWMMMRENMRVLFSKEDAGNMFSIVLFLCPDGGPNGIGLVKYTMTENKINIISVEMTEQDLSLYGTYMGLVKAEGLCFGINKKTQLNKDSVVREESKIESFELKFSDKDPVKIQVDKKPSYFIESIPPNSDVTDIVYYDQDNKVVESMKEDITYLYTEKK